MKEILFSEIKPFVRFSREIGYDMRKFQSFICGYDHRLLYCIEGEGKISIENREYNIKKGSLLLWKAGVPYKYHSVGSTMKFIGINFDFMYKLSDTNNVIPPEKYDVFDRTKIIENIKFKDAEIFNKPIVMNGMFWVYNKLKEIDDEYKNQMLHYKEKCSGLLLNILGNIASIGENYDGEGNETVNKIIRYMNENADKELSNERLGEIFGYHPNYLNQLFVKHTKKTIHKYLQELRISRAIYLLENTDLSVSDICSRVGFNDLPHFSRYFKKQTGYSPLNFRP